MATSSLDIQDLLSKPRIRAPLIKILFEVYHACRPFHHLKDPHYPSIKRSVVLLFFVALRWYFFLKRLIGDKKMLNTPLSRKEKFALFIGILGHLLIIWAQNATIKHEKETENEDEIEINYQGPYKYIRHPHHLGKWTSEGFVAIYQNNKISMAISVLTAIFTINRANKEELTMQQEIGSEYDNYKQRVPNKFIYGLY